MQKIKLIFTGLIASLLIGCVSIEDKKGSPEEIAKVNTSLAKSYYSKGLYDIAEEKLEKALEGNAENIGANTLLAMVYDQQGRVSEASVQFENTLDLAQHNSVEFAEISNNYAVFLCKNGNWVDAEQHFVDAVNVAEYRTKAGALENAGYCALGANELAKSMTYFEKALSENKQMLRSMLGLAKASVSMKEWGKARSALKDFHENTNTTDESLYYMVMVENASNNNDEKLKYINELKTHFPNSEFLKKLNNSSKM